MKIRKTISLVVALLIVAACAPASEQTSQIHWTYSGEAGPDNWGELDRSYATCGEGTHQSPIDLAVPTPGNIPNVGVFYGPSEVNILNNGHTVQVNYDAGSYIDLDGVRYDVAQFHYHAPSEHAFNGQTFPAELHIVHKNADGKLAVIGILLTEGAENAAYQPFIGHLPAEESEAHSAGVTIDAAQLLPQVQTAFRYTGSLTTPPCTEGVSWLVMTTPVEISAAQIASLADVFAHGNNRPVQPLNDRALVEDVTP